MVKNPPAIAKGMGSIPGLGRFPGKETATHSSILAWEIPRTEEPGRLQSMGVTKESDMTERLNKTVTQRSLMTLELPASIPYY